MHLFWLLIRQSGAIFISKPEGIKRCAVTAKAAREVLGWKPEISLEEGWGILSRMDEQEITGQRIRILQSVRK